MRELEDWSAVERQILLTIEFERDGHHAAGGSAGCLRALFVVVRGGANLGILEDRGVELDGFFSLVIEPQARRDFLHMRPCRRARGLRGDRAILAEDLSSLTELAAQTAAAQPQEGEFHPSLISSLRRMAFGSLEPGY